MFTIDQAQEILEELAEEIPEPFYRQLNGGILLLPDTVVSEEAQEDDLFIMGEYYDDPALGRYIVIYFGSLLEVMGEDVSPEEAKEELRETLRHEFTHHIESLAGERGLEIKDALEMERYYQGLPPDEDVE